LTDSPPYASALCPSPGTSATLSWTAAPGATSYALRVDNTTTGTSNNPCPGGADRTNGDYCNEAVSGISIPVSTIAGDSYRWWIHSCNAYGCNWTTPLGPTNFNCTACVSKGCEANTCVGSTCNNGCIPNAAGTKSCYTCSICSSTYKYARTNTYQSTTSDCMNPTTTPLTYYQDCNCVDGTNITTYPVFYLNCNLTFSCTGTVPSNATLCSGDGTGLSANTARTPVSSCTAAKCEYTCNSGYVLSGGACVPVTYSCSICSSTYKYARTNTYQSTTSDCMNPTTTPLTYYQDCNCVDGTNITTYPVFYLNCNPTFSCTGTVPSNATLCSGDGTGLTGITSYNHVLSCSSPAGSPPKCEFTCNSEYVYSGGLCVPITYDWYHNKGACSEPCGDGTKIISHFCMDSNNISAPDSSCPQPKPSDKSETCNDGACPTINKWKEVTP